ncbi:MAG: hypothetical protein H8D34_02350 [Chloroflexi bacterium]|nr:hypothetical protein [Chloroflexota bacterium]
MSDHDTICCVCGHELDMHINEEGGWRCHSLAGDGYQCECWLRKRRNKSIQDYSLGKRTREHIAELKEILDKPADL